MIEGITHLLSFVPGDFAVVLHSEPDCANLVYRDRRAVDPSRFFCSNLGEADAIAGRGASVLAGAIRRAVEVRRPSTVFVVGGCVAGLIGDETAGMARSVGLPAGTRVVALDGGAFAMHGQVSIVDKFTGLMARAARPRARPRRPAFNVVGFRRDEGEAAAVFGAAGIAINSWPLLSSAESEWRALPAAPLTVVSDSSLFDGLAKAARRWPGHSVMEVPPPFGLSPTERFYADVAGHFGKTSPVRGAFEQPMRTARRIVAETRRRFRGLRLAYHMGGRKDFEMHTLVRGGLGFVPFFRELGFEVRLMFQGPVEDTHRRRIESLLACHGIDSPFQCLPDRLSLARALRAGGFGLVYCPDTLGAEAVAAGVPVIPTGTLEPGWEGTVRNCRRIAKLLGGNV